MSSDNLLDRILSDLVQELIELYPNWDGVKQFKGTPSRLVGMYRDFCWSQEKIEEELVKQFKVFDNGYNGMLVVKDISVWTLCPHHLLPCQFKVFIGYIPTGKVLGLSKFARIADILARRPVMQEQYSTELADLLMKRLQPKGVAVYIVGQHGCMTSRGVKQHSDVVTSVVRGDFLKEGLTREEFFAICRS